MHHCEWELNLHLAYNFDSFLLNIFDSFCFLSNPSWNKVQMLARILFFLSKICKFIVKDLNKDRNLESLKKGKKNCERMQIRAKIIQIFKN